jgi:uncharacterized membrane protein YecN with MAPEG domain
MPLGLPLAATAIYAAILALFLVILAMVVISLRRGLRVSLGDGGHASLQQAIRAHGNAAEFIPIFLIMLAAFELNRGPAWAVHAFGASFVLARLAHAAGLYLKGARSNARVVGVVATFTVLIVLALANLRQVFLA